ncbi:MAG: carcinine hydrolase/isopenicillin-N N-acyltransferase family protein [Bacilli bacterium]|nr:carcinine hydrolase/isopenicillin-N N-acyltransferase family protein [Bacilli bacterium]
MCDTLYQKNKHFTIFGKNSDRSANEPNLVILNKAKDNQNKTLTCTYIDIPEVNHSYANILVKPSWIWGAEMGINEYHLVIGNEAVFTKKKKKTPSLIGMDFLRLALERAKSAPEAIDVITNLLQTHGQGGNCGYDKQFFYDNSYLIADPSEAFILETVGKEYKIKKLITSGNISNRLSITEDNFKQKHSDFLFTTFSKSKLRERSGKTRLQQELNIEKMIAILQSHNGNLDKLYTKGSVGSICMHQSLLGDHTTGSMVVDIKEVMPTIWLTGSSTPCLAIYKPVYFNHLVAPLFADEAHSLAYWLRYEYLFRAIYSGYVEKDIYLIKRNHIQRDLFAKEAALRKANATPQEFYHLSQEAMILEESFLNEYEEIIQKVRTGKLLLKGLWQKKTKGLIATHEK